jgi:hypothetical protein
MFKKLKYKCKVIDILISGCLRLKGFYFSCQKQKMLKEKIRISIKFNIFKVKLLRAVYKI